jgi:transposase-like protein
MLEPSPPEGTQGPACPFCESKHAELISLFGSQLLMSQFRCTGCGTYFEGLRDDHRTEV